GVALAGLCDRFIGTDEIPMSTSSKQGGRVPSNNHGDRIVMGPDKLRDPAAMRAAGLDPRDKRVAMVPWLVERMVGLPRHRAIHTGGFVLSERPIFEVCP